MKTHYFTRQCSAKRKDVFINFDKVLKIGHNRTSSPSGQGKRFLAEIHQIQKLYGYESKNIPQYDISLSRMI